MLPLTQLTTPTSKRIIASIISAFLITFILARLTVYLVLGHWLPNLFLVVGGAHIHHFTYGVVILVLVGLYFILKRPEAESDQFRWATLIYGIGLGLTVDEFGMWIMLRDDYWVRQSYDAIIIVTLLLLNIAYYKFIIQVLNLLFVKWWRKRK